MNAEVETKKEQQAGTTDERTAEERFVAPRARIVETEHAYVVTAEMPGVGKDGVDVTIDDDKLVITGRRTTKSPDGRLVYRESRQANYRRAFELEGLVEADNVSAKIENGILRVELPKTEALKPRKIEVA